jgi:hypothetical protein
MSPRPPKPIPASLRAAFEADKTLALRKHLGVERLAELMSTTPATLYKWIEQESMPVKALLSWQHLTGGSNVVRFLASRAASVVIAIPHGRPTTADDVHALQSTLHGATGALLSFMSGDIDRDTTLGHLGTGLESLAWHRENVKKSDQPELDLEG